PAILRHSHTDGESEEKCFKFRSTKKSEESKCRPVKTYTPRFYRQLKPCKPDKELAVQHPKYLGVYPRCDVPYKPEFDCMDPCELVDRIDDTMYKPSASLDRKYERYWVECFIPKTKRCCRKVPAERSVRSQVKSCLQVPRPKPCYMVNPMPCKIEVPPSPCPKMTICNCPEGNTTGINCRLAPRKRRCRRRPCLYPSFSECQHEELNVGRPVECRCLDVPPMCLVYRELAKNRRGFCDPIPPPGHQHEC
ncbi:hypothetical protein KR032_005700, partial [Drosophila birchii]